MKIDLCDLRGKRVLVMGLGIKDGGVGAALYALRKGALVTVTDLKDERLLSSSLLALKGAPVAYRLGRHVEEDFLSADLIIKNEGIKRSHHLLELAAARGIPVCTPMKLFWASVTRPYIAVTGTKGKSLTAHIIAHVLSRLQGRCIAAGNNCVSPLHALDEPQPIHVLELSSWQLTGMDADCPPPRVAVWTSFFRDHLDYYSGMDEYFEDKRRITCFQKNEDFAVLPGDDERLAGIETKAEKIYFCGQRPARKGCYYTRDKILFCDCESERPVLEIASLPPSLRVPHYLRLIAASAAAVIAFTGTSDGIGGALASFPGLPHRFQTIYDDCKIIAVNDSAATTPDSVILALRAVTRPPLALIAGGGGHKNLSYTELAAEVRAHAEMLILFRDDPTSTILAREREIALHPLVVFVNTMEEAVLKGIEFLRLEGRGTLLLSPGSSGAPSFPDLFARGELYTSFVHEQLAKKGR